MKQPSASLAILTLLIAACGSAGSNDTLPTGPLGAGPYPIATLDITITHPDAEDVMYTISCLGDTATLIGEVPVGEQAACAAMASDAVKTRLVDGPPLDRACTEIYGGPDVAHIRGTFDGATVETTIDRTNGCGIDEWDRLFAGILPSALGNVGG